MKMTQFPSSVLSLCLIVITQSGCQHHHDGAGDIITKLGNGVISSSPVGGNALKGNTTAASSGNCDVIGAAATTLNSQGAISALQLGQIGLGVEQTKTTQIIATYTLTDTSQNQKHFFASLIVDQSACSVSMFSTGELVAKVAATTACDYSGVANDAFLTANLNKNSDYQVTETLLSSYSTSDPKAPPPISVYSAIYGRTIVELYRVFQSTAPAKQYGVLFVIDKDNCKSLEPSSYAQLLPQGSATVAPVPKSAAQQNQSPQQNQQNRARQR